MGLFCGKKCKCKQRCKSWFGMQPDLERACKNACKSNTSFDKDVFQCSGKYVDERAIMVAYGYDPCANNEVEMDNILDPLGTQEDNQERLKTLMPLFLVLTILIGLGVFFLIKRK